MRLRLCPALARRAALAALVGTLGLVATSCSSTRTDESVELPFHVALAPVELVAKRALPAQMPDESVRFVLADGALDERLASSLEQRCFARVTLLEPQELDESGRVIGNSFVEQARALGVEVLAVPRLVFDPVVAGDTNDRFWLNLPLFLFGGPFCWFVPDRTYVVDATVDVDLHDMEELYSASDQYRSKYREDSLVIPRTENGRFHQVRSVFENADYNFLERAGAGVHHYFLSIVWPAGWLACTTDTVEARVSDAALAGLTERIATNLIEDRHLVVDQNSYLVFVEADALRAQRDGAGNIVVAGRVHMKREGTAQFRGATVVLPEGREVDLEVREVETADATTQVFDVWSPGFAPEANVGHVKVVVDLRGVVQPRRFTVAVESAPLDVAEALVLPQPAPAGTEGSSESATAARSSGSSAELAAHAEDGPRRSSPLPR